MFEVNYNDSDSMVLLKFFARPLGLLGLLVIMTVFTKNLKDISIFLINHPEVIEVIFGAMLFSLWIGLLVKATPTLRIVSISIFIVLMLN